MVLHERLGLYYKNNVHTIFITTLDRFSRDRKNNRFLVKHKLNIFTLFVKIKYFHAKTRR